MHKMISSVTINKSKTFLFKTKIIINAVPVENIKTQDG